VTNADFFPKAYKLVSCIMFNKTVHGLFLSWAESWFIRQDSREDIQLIQTKNLLFILLSVFSICQTSSMDKKRDGNRQLHLCFPSHFGICFSSIFWSPN